MDEREEPPEWDESECWHPMYLLYRNELEPWRPFDFTEFWGDGELPELW